MPFPTPHESLMDSISRWEGEWQAMPEDSGNWVDCPEGRLLIGTMRGVTPAALAQHLGIDACSLTEAKMRETVTLELAAEIGLKGYYRGPGFDRLAWSPLVWLAVEIGWGSGPSRAVKMLQDLIGVPADGKIGPQTRAAYDRFIQGHEIGAAVDDLAQARRDFYLSISEPGSKNAKFRKGWLRRADYYTTTGNGEEPAWWPKWAGWTPSGGAEPHPEPGEPGAGDAPAPPAPGPELVATATADVQRALNGHARELGFAPLKVDGIAGRLTWEAVTIALGGMPAAQRALLTGGLIGT